VYSNARPCGLTFEKKEKLKYQSHATAMNGLKVSEH